MRLRGGELTPRRAALSVGVGATIGCTPLFGTHLFLVMAICLPLKLDAPVSYLAANISNPLIAPFLLFAEVQIGSVMLTGRTLGFSAGELSARGVGGLALQTAIGTTVFAPAVGLILGALTYALVRVARRRRGA